ncbi:MAG: ATP-binding protein [Desulfobacteraceae bacterium]|jgi:PAS domain S-box-containing protein
MLIFSALHIFTFTSLVYLGIYVIAINPRERLNHECAGVMLCMAIWSLEHMIIQFPGTPYQSARLWLQLGAVGWIGLPVTILRFALVFTGCESHLNKAWFQALTIGPFMVLLTAQWQWLIIDDLQRFPYGWAHSFANSIWSTFFYAYYLIFIGWTLYLLARYARASRRRVFQSLASMLFYVISACLIIGFATDVILPLLRIRSIPPLGPLITLLWAAGLTYALVRYKFLTITPAMAANDILTTIGDLLILCDLQGTIVRVNHAACRMLGYQRQELEGQNVNQYFAADQTAEPTELSEQLIDQSIHNIRLQLNTRHNTKTTIMLSATRLRDVQGDLCGTVFVAKDITDQVQAMEEMQQLEARLHKAQKMEAIGTLAGGVAHDLNNILSGIVSYPDLLLMQLPEESDLRNPLELIRGSGQKAATIVEDLLTLARRGVSNHSVLNLNRIIADFLSSPEHNKQRSFFPQVSVSTDLAENVHNIQGSEIHIYKTLMNLLTNAFEAISDSGTITISTRNQWVDQAHAKRFDAAPGNYCILRVADDGMGIAPEDQDRIFEPFYTKKVMGRSGTGLGMAVVYGTIRDHGGFIEITSKPNQGTRFDLHFPSSEGEVLKENSSIPPSIYQGQGESILVADDVPEQRTILCAMLNRLGYQPQTVSSGDEALAFIQRHPMDLIVLDMIMEPEMDGLDTYRAILHVRPEQKAIIATGYAETERVKQALALGAANHVKKPYSFEEIGMAIHAALKTPFGELQAGSTVDPAIGRGDPSPSALPPHPSFPCQRAAPPTSRKTP